MSKRHVPGAGGLRRFLEEGFDRDFYGEVFSLDARDDVGGIGGCAVAAFFLAGVDEVDDDALIRKINMKGALISTERADWIAGRINGP